MTVRVLKSIHANYQVSVASVHAQAIARQKLGERLPQVYSQRANIIDDIVLDAIVAANAPLYQSDKVRVPEWAERASFDKFISKITNYANDYIS